MPSGTSSEEPPTCSGAAGFISRLMCRPFMRFALVGVAAYLVDTAVLIFATIGLGLGPYAGRAISLGAATLFAWYGNRRWTFREGATRDCHRAVAAELVRALAARGASVLLNYILYAALVALAPWPFNNPYLAVVIAGAITMVMNFQLMRVFVFNRDRAVSPRTGGQD